MNSQASTPGNTNRRELMLMALSFLLIGMFLWRAFVPAHEYAMRTAQVLTIVSDLGMILGLIGLKSQLTTMRALFWIALFAGVGLFAMRLTSDAAWWTGHFMYSLR